LLHGVGLRAEAWNAQADALVQAGFNVVAPDMLGHGESDYAPIPATLADYVAPVAEQINQPVIVVGHSMGAMMALELAAECANHVQGVVALNAIYQRSAEASAAVRARADALDGKTMADPADTLKRWFGAVSSSQADACREWLMTVDPAAYKSAYTVFANSDGPSVELLRGLTCPALFITGAQEPNSTPEMSRQMAALAPKGRSEVIAGAAHMMPMTHASAVNACVVKFAKECLT
jgi:pimeloyl-ACP methyl ester carboxylesterase